MYRFIQTLTKLLLSVCLIACGQKSQVTSGEDAAPVTEAVTPVTITHPALGSMADSVQLNAVSAFLLKSYVKANATGYLQQVHAMPGQLVDKGQVLFVIKTKEAQSLGNTISGLDSSFHFNGTITLPAQGRGYITQLNYRSGDYVQDGEQLATITDPGSFVFLLDLPYELRPYLHIGQLLNLSLPDGSHLDGHVSRSLPVVDAASQTQQFVIQLSKPVSNIPENLVAKISLWKNIQQQAVSLPKAAVLSDDTQSSFWIMKMIDSVTAVKTPIQKGLETNDRVQVLSPVLHATDSILLTGNYGLPDTAKVTITR
jgi:multidrug efflux pump subunit AcrA (membrane-fusion protein)